MTAEREIVERRRYPRDKYTAFLRPQFRLSFGSYQVLDASMTGIRLSHSVAARPPVGSGLRGTLEFPYGQAPLHVSATVVWVTKTEVALSFQHGTIPPGYLVSTF